MKRTYDIQISDVSLEDILYALDGENNPASAGERNLSSTMKPAHLKKIKGQKFSDKVADKITTVRVVKSTTPQAEILFTTGFVEVEIKETEGEGAAEDNFSPVVAQIATWFGELPSPPPDSNISDLDSIDAYSYVEPGCYTFELKYPSDTQKIFGEDNYHLDYELEKKRLASMPRLNVGDSLRGYPIFLYLEFFKDAIKKTVKNTNFSFFIVRTYKLQENKRNLHFSCEYGERGTKLRVDISKLGAVKIIGLEKVDEVQKQEIIDLIEGKILPGARDMYHHETLPDRLKQG